MVGNSLPRFCFSGNRKQNRRVTEVRKRTRIDNNNTNLDNIENIEKKTLLGLITKQYCSPREAYTTWSVGRHQVDSTWYQVYN